MVSKYQKRISGPLLDRIDIHLQVQRVPIQKLAALDGGEPSSVIRPRVEATRARQAKRLTPLGKPDLLANGDMGPAEVRAFCRLDEAGRQLVRAAAAQMRLSAREYHRVLKLAESPLGAIADLNTSIIERAIRLTLLHRLDLSQFLE